MQLVLFLVGRPSGLTKQAAHGPSDLMSLGFGPYRVYRRGLAAAE